MCYAIPGKVQSIEGRIALINYFGEIKRAVHELALLAPGDYVYAQGGYVINKVSAAEAESVLSAWKEMFFTLQETDRVYSVFSLANQPADPRLKNILNKATEGKDLTPEDARVLFSREKTEEINLVFKTANYLRHQYHKNACCVHGIVELSNYCRRNCFYCGISSYNKELERYRMSMDEVVDAVSSAANNYGFKAFVLQSGEDCGYGIDELAEIISRVKKRNDCFIVISFGEMDEGALRKLFAAGARGLLMRFETSNSALYEKLHPGYSLGKRVETIKLAYEIGYMIITGSLVGLPGQSQEDIMNDIFFARELHPEMFSCGPFLRHPNTPLAGDIFSDEQLVFKTLAAARLILPREVTIPVTTAFETLSPRSRLQGLISGANSVMVNLTPLKYRKLYSLYPGRAHDDEDVSIQIKETVALLQSLGRAPVDPGNETIDKNSF